MRLASAARCCPTPGFPPVRLHRGEHTLVISDADADVVDDLWASPESRPLKGSLRSPLELAGGAGRWPSPQHSPARALRPRSIDPRAQSESLSTVAHRQSAPPRERWEPSPAGPEPREEARPESTAFSIYAQPYPRVRRREPIPGRLLPRERLLVRPLDDRHPRAWHGRSSLPVHPRSLPLSRVSVPQRRFEGVSVAFDCG